MHLRICRRIALYSTLAALLAVGTSLWRGAEAAPGVSVSYDNGAALLSDGSVVAWGVTPMRIVTSPIRAWSQGGVTSIAQGGNHILLARSDGTVWAAGQNNAGQLGDGSNQYRPGFAQIAGLGGVVSVAAAQSTSYALHADGSVSSWGANSYGQLGDGSSGDRARPAKVPALTGITALATTGWGHALALRADATVVAWGQNGPGNLGDGTRVSRSTPVPVTGLSGVVAIATGDGHSLALRGDGTVWTWGYNANGQLGHSTANAVVNATRVPGLSDVTGIAGNGNRSLAWKVDGTLWTWGSNASGSLGIGDSVRTQVSTPTQVTGIGLVAGAAGGLNHTVVWDTTGSVYAWGQNRLGGLGDGSLTDRSSPVRVQGPGGQGSLNLFAGMPANVNDHPHPVISVTPLSGVAPLTLTLDARGTRDPDGSVVRYDWYASSGQAASGQQATMVLSSPGTHSILLSATDDAGASSIEVLTVHVAAAAGAAVNPMISAAATHSLGLKSDGTAWAWGTSAFTGARRGNPSFKEVTPVTVGISGIREVSAGFWSHSLAVTTAGEAWGWGDNASGQLGNGRPAAFNNDPVKVVIDNVESAAAGDRFSVFLKRDGSVWAAGYNADGRLADGSTVDRSTPVRIPGLSDVIAIAAGKDHAMALKRNGSLWSWGRNEYGQLGDGSAVTRTIPVRVNLPSVRRISASNHSLALTADGTIWAWGANYRGQLGDGTLQARGLPVRVSMTRPIEQIAAGGNHSLAVDATGEVFSWGANCFADSDGCAPTGQLGDGSSSDRSTPAPVRGLDRVIAISAAYASSMALRFDGTVWMWGWNNDGQLGDGTLAYRFAPQLVAAEGGTGFFDLLPTIANVIAPDKIPPFSIIASDTGSGSIRNVTATVQFRAEDVGTSKSLYVFALAPATRVQGGPAASAVKVGNAKSMAKADTPIACVLAQLNASGQMVAVTSSNLAAYLTGVLSAQGASVSILNGVPAANVSGATFFVGYGGSATAMLNTGINRAAVTVPGSLTCQPSAPQTGWWWNPLEDGRGFSIEKRGNNLFFAAFLYDISGRSTWYVSSGPVSLEGSLYNGELLAASGGQTLGGPYVRFPTLASAGAMTMTFNNESTGTLVWAGGTVPIQRFNIVPNGLTAAPVAGTPESGWWWNDAEAGRGFFMEWQNGTLDIAGYMYDDAGNPVWYVTVGGTSTTNPQNFSGTWWSYTGGQTLTGPWRQNARTNSNVAPLTITFSGPDTALMTLPNGRTTNLRRHRF